MSVLRHFTILGHFTARALGPQLLVFLPCIVFSTATMHWGNPVLQTVQNPGHYPAEYIAERYPDGYAPCCWRCVGITLAFYLGGYLTDLLLTGRHPEYKILALDDRYGRVWLCAGLGCFLLSLLLLLGCPESWFGVSIFLMIADLAFWLITLLILGAYDAFIAVILPEIERAAADRQAHRRRIEEERRLRRLAQEEQERERQEREEQRRRARRESAAAVEELTAWYRQMKEKIEREITDERMKEDMLLLLDGRYDDLMKQRLREMNP